MTGDDHILFVGAGGDGHAQVQRELARDGCAVVTASSVDGAVRALDEQPIDLVVADLDVSHDAADVSPDNELGLVRHVCENYPDTAVIVMAGSRSPATAHAAGKMGTHAYLEKPVAPDALLDEISQGLEKARRRRLMSEGSSTDDDDARWGILGRSPPIRRLREKIPGVARSDAPVLIHGESGSGKELAARAVHQESSRSGAKFLSVNCAAFTTDLLDSELFGHERGGFTGANRTRRGLFRAADGGTLFLDEVAEMSPEQQAKLLRVLDDGLVRPVGTTKEHRVDVRVITATHEDLEQLVQERRFREDLYFRVAVLRLEVPPLRTRGKDILLLARHFLDRFTKPGERCRFSDDARERLMNHEWPGNVRVLATVMQRLAALHAGQVIRPRDLSRAMRFRLKAKSRANMTLEEANDEHVRLVYDDHRCNQTATAESLGIARETLRGYLRRMGSIE